MEAIKKQGGERFVVESIDDKQVHLRSKDGRYTSRWVGRVAFDKHYLIGGESKESTTRDPKASYYDAGGIETLDILKAKLTPEQFEGYLLGNILKYSTRINFKHDDKTRDAEKIAHYAKALEELNEERK